MLLELHCGLHSARFFFGSNFNHRPHKSIDPEWKISFRNFQLDILDLLGFCMKASTNSKQFVPFLNGTLSPIQFAFLKSPKVSGFSQEIFDPKTR